MIEGRTGAAARRSRGSVWRRAGMALFAASALALGAVIPAPVAAAVAGGAAEPEGLDAPAPPA